MITTTIRSSMRVKPLRERDIAGNNVLGTLSAIVPTRHRDSASPHTVFSQRRGRDGGESVSRYESVTSASIVEPVTSPVVVRFAHPHAACNGVSASGLALGIHPVGALTDVHDEGHGEALRVLHFVTQDLGGELELRGGRLDNELVMNLEDHPALHGAPGK